MHGFSSGTALLVNAEVDSMGGAVDSGVGIDTKTSPRRTAIEKAQAELRQEYDFREERKRELEFLEKGGNPLDFKFGHASSVSVQSTSPTDRHPEQFATSEAKGSFALTASPHGESVESIDRTEVPTVSEPNTADNLLLFDGDESRDGERNPLHLSRTTVAPEQSSQMNGDQNAKESEVSGVVRKNQAYARRNRTKSNRDGARSNSQKDHHKISNSNTKSAGPNGDVIFKTVQSDDQLDIGKIDVADPSNQLDKQNNQQLKVDVQKTPTDLACVPEFCGAQEQVVSVSLDCQPSAATMNTKNRTSSGQQNGFRKSKRDRRGIRKEGPKGLDSESSCTQTSVSLDVNNDSDMCTNTRNLDSNGSPSEQTVAFERNTDVEGVEVVKEINDAKTTENGDIIADDRVNDQDHSDVCVVKVEDEVHGSRPDSESDVKHIEEVEQNDHIASKRDTLSDNLLHDNDNSNLKEKYCTDKPQGVNISTFCEPHEKTLPEKASTSFPKIQTPSGNHLKWAEKAHEDSILEEARIIQAKRKRITELSVGVLPFEICRNSHWDFVLEEMSWLANDFMQERLWKMAAAAQTCHQAAFASQLRFEKQGLCWSQKRVAHMLAKAVMQFWQSAELLLKSEDPIGRLKECKFDVCGSKGAGENEVAEDRIENSEMETSKDLQRQNCGKNLAVQRYAMRFLKISRSHLSAVHAEPPVSPDQAADMGIPEMAWEDHFTEESLFYTVAPCAMETYRKSIETYVVRCEKTGSSMQEEVETSTFDAGADVGSQENVYEEDEGETSTYYLPAAAERRKLSKIAQRKRKNMMKSYPARPGELGSDMLYGHCIENKMGNQQLGLVGRPPNGLNVGSIPTKRVRTASRQRVPSPFSGGVAGGFQVQAKTDASSGDTNSLQDDQSTLQGGSQVQKSLEDESMGFEKLLPFDCAEISKPKQKKKAKNLGLTYDQRWQLDSTAQIEKRDHLKRRLESHQFESNGNSGQFGQHAIKKPRIVKHPLDNSFDTGSIPSPVASQMSNMSNSNKFIKMIGGRDRGKKSKVLKIPSGQPGSGRPWSLFEDQALVVLVHDMGPNWELVSDCINSTLQLKCIFRKPKECKERHKILMDRTTGDGADSAEDSGSSQPYPSTLPGIPKGSARQLFQRLQGPMEEDTLKAHFEKIISIVQQQHYQKKQNDKQEPKQIAPVHNSHMLALSQACPNNINGPPLTPLDLIDAATSNPEGLPLGYQGSHTSSLAISPQGPVASILPASGPNSSLQGSSGMILGGNLSSPPGPLNGSVRDGTYGVPRATSLPVDEQQRMQQYNHMLSVRNLPQSTLSVSGAVSGTGRGVRMLPGGNGMGMMCGMNRGMPMSRPGLQAIPSSSMLNAGSMLSSSMMGMPSPVNIHSRAGSSQGNSMLRPHEAMHITRPGQTAEHQRQTMLPDIQMQVTQGSNQGIAPFSGLSSPFPNQSIPSPVQTHRVHSPKQHQMSPQQSHLLSNNSHHQAPSSTQQQAYAIRLAKERQMQQRMLHQQQQLAASNALMPHVQSQPQMPISSAVPNSSQIQPQASSQPVSLTPLTPTSPMTPTSSQIQQKHHVPPHGLGRNSLPAAASGLTNHMGKQRQRQRQFQQAGRNHPQQQRQSSQSQQQQAKVLKGIGRGNVLMHQNLPVDPSHLNGLTTPSGSQAMEKGEQVMQLTQGQGLYSGSGLNSVQAAKPLALSQSSNQPQPQQKLYSGGAAPPLSKQLPHMPPLSENKPHGQVSSVPSGQALSTSHQDIPSPLVASTHQQMQPQPQAQPLPKQRTQSQSTVHRILQQNCQMNSDMPSKPQMEQPQAAQQPAVNLSQLATATTMPLACVDSTSVVPVVSSAGSSQWEATEPVYEAALPNPAAQSGSSSSPSLANSAGSEPIARVSQGLGHRHLSGSLSPHGHNTREQWQQQQPQLQHPSPSALPPPPSQQQQQREESQQQSPQQELVAQPNSQHVAQSSMYVRSGDSRLE